MDFRGRGRGRGMGRGFAPPKQYRSRDNLSSERSGPEGLRITVANPHGLTGERGGAHTGESRERSRDSSYRGDSHRDQNRSRRNERSHSRSYSRSRSRSPESKRHDDRYSSNSKSMNSSKSMNIKIDKKTLENPLPYLPQDNESLRITVGNDRFIHEGKGDTRRDMSRERSRESSSNREGRHEREHSRDRSYDKYERDNSRHREKVDDRDRYRDKVHGDKRGSRELGHEAQRYRGQVGADDPIFTDLPASPHRSASPPRSTSWERDPFQRSGSFQRSEEQERASQPLKSILKKKMDDVDQSSQDRRLEEENRGQGHEEFTLPGLGNDAPQTSLFSGFGIGRNEGGIPGLGSFDVEDEDAFLYGDEESTQVSKTSDTPSLASSSLEIRSDQPLRERSSYQSMEPSPKRNYQDTDYRQRPRDAGYRESPVSYSSDDRNRLADRGPRYTEESKFIDQDARERASYLAPEHMPTERREHSLDSRHSEDDIHDNRMDSKFSANKPPDRSKQETSISDKEKTTQSLAKDPTIESILKSIGFNFELSKMMQEKAKKERDVEPDPSHFGITDQTTTFLGGGVQNVEADPPPVSKEPVKRKKYSEILTKQESYEERARRYREQQAKSGESPPIDEFKRSGSNQQSGLGMLQDSYEDYLPRSSTGSHHPHHPADFKFGGQAQYEDMPYMGEPDYGHDMDFPPGGGMGFSPRGRDRGYNDHEFTVGMDYQPQASAISGHSLLTVVPTVELDFSSGGKVDPSKREMKSSGRQYERRTDRSNSAGTRRTVVPPRTEEETRKIQVSSGHSRSSSIDKARSDAPRTERPTSAENKEDRRIEMKKQEKPAVPGEGAAKPDRKPVLSQKEKERLLKEREERQKRLETLEKELMKLRKQQNELMRKKQRQKDGHKDPLLVENSKLQEEIAHQISALRKASEENLKILKEVDSSSKSKNKPDPVDSKKIKAEPKEKIKPAVKKEKDVKPQIKKEAESPKRKEAPKSQGKIVDESVKEKQIHYDYFDGGNHWCRLCNYTANNVYGFFSHINTSKHKLNMDIDPYNRPWMPESMLSKAKPVKAQRSLSVPMKGIEFMLPSSAFYCTLCKEFSGDMPCAEEHLKSESHNEKFQKYVDENPFYERRLNLDRAASLYVSDSFKKDTDKRKISDEEDDEEVDEKRQRMEEKKSAPEKESEISSKDSRDDKKRRSVEKKVDRREDYSKEKDNSSSKRTPNSSKADSARPLRFNLKFKQHDSESKTPSKDWDADKSKPRSGGFGKFGSDVKEKESPSTYRKEKDSWSNSQTSKFATLEARAAKINIRLSGKTSTKEQPPPPPPSRRFPQKPWPKQTPELPDASSLRKTMPKITQSTGKRGLILSGPLPSNRFVSSGSKDLKSLPVVKGTRHGPPQAELRAFGPTLPPNYSVDDPQWKPADPVNSNRPDQPVVDPSIMGGKWVGDSSGADVSNISGDMDDAASDGSAISMHMDSDFEVLDECDDEA